MCRFSFFIVGFIVATVMIFVNNALAYVEDYHIEIERKDTNYAPISSSIQTGKPVVFYSFPTPNVNDAHAPWILRTQSFLIKYINGFSDKAMIVDFDNVVVPTSQKDYFNLIAKEIERSNVALFVPNTISDVDSIYRSNFASSGINFDNYWDVFFETKMTLEEVLGSTNFDYRRYIRRRSSFLQYNNAVKEKKNIIFVHYETIYPSYLDIDKHIDAFRNIVGSKAYILPIKNIARYYEDPAVEALSNCSDSLFCIYNPATNKAFPLIGVSEEMTKEDYNDWATKVR